MESKDDLTPQAFKPLNDFVLKEAAESVSNRNRNLSSNFVFHFDIGYWEA